MMKLLYFMSFARGGVADYACVQANAIHQLGVDITLLTGKCFQNSTGLKCKHIKKLPSQSTPRNASFIRRLFSGIKYNMAIHSMLKKVAISGGYTHILLGCFFEYFSPFWVEYISSLRKSGIKVGVIAHDPIRYFVSGPQWWHRWSIRCVYKNVDCVFVHQAPKLDTGGLKNNVHVIDLPFGPNALAAGTIPRKAMRLKFNIADNQFVLLVFGHLREEKNIDLLLEAIKKFPTLVLIVVGDENSQSQKPAHYYKSIAKKVGVDNQCRWDVRYVSGSEIGDYFEMCDAVALTYKKTFQSASSALNTAAHYRKPVIASSGRGPMKFVVEKYCMGIWVAPDSVAEIVRGLDFLLSNTINPNWDMYELENSWEENARRVVNALM